MAGKVFQVSEINLYIKNLFRNDYLLQRLQVEGEVSNAKLHSSGHIYFTIKDESAAIDCVLFSGYAKDLKILPRDGEKIIVMGSLGLYEKTGRYQIYVRDLSAGGQGDFSLRLEALKKKLSAEGIFQKPKRMIPRFPERIGIVTSATGAAIQDILQIKNRRNKGIQLILYPSLVQGERAAENIARGIEYFNQEREKVDLIIVGRGGGSLEDLWAFNEELVVRAIYHSKLPVISAVGHETDTTLSDWVSDLRAPTPSAAAELAIPEIAEQRQMIKERQRELNREWQIYLQQFRHQLQTIDLRLKAYHPRKKLEELRFAHLESEKNLAREFGYFLKKARWQWQMLFQQLQSLNPQNKLTAGYVYLADSTGKPVESVKELQKGEKLWAWLRDGKLKLEVEEINSAGQKE